MKFADVYELYVDRVFRYAYRRLPDQATAEDVTSEVFLRALQAIDRYEDRGQLTAWLLRIAYNAITDFYRQRPTENIDDLELPDDGSLEERVMRRVEVRRIGALIDQLPPRQREAMVLYFGQDLAQEDVAAAMGVSRGAVQLLVHRGVTNLRREIAA